MHLMLYLLPLCTLTQSLPSSTHQPSLNRRVALPPSSIKPQEALGYYKYNGKRPPFYWYQRHGLDWRTGSPKVAKASEEGSSAAKSAQLPAEKARESAERQLKSAYQQEAKWRGKKDDESASEEE